MVIACDPSTNEVDISILMLNVQQKAIVEDTVRTGLVTGLNRMLRPSPVRRITASHGRRTKSRIKIISP